MALNDPQWGRRGGGGDGPPDLDELWNRLRQRIYSLFGGRGGPREGGTGGGFSGGVWIIAALVLVVWLGSGLYIVDASQRGVVLRFGKPERSANGTVVTTMPGPRWHLPWPIESVEIVNVSQVRTIEIGYEQGNVKRKLPKQSLMLTQDENIIDLQFAVQYVLKDPGEFLFNNRSPDEAVMQVAESAMREVVGKSTMEEVLYKGREDVRAAAQARMQKILDEYRTGISVSQLTLQQAQPPEQVQAAFDDAVKANQDRERQINEGEAYRNDVVPKASGTASRLVQEAEGYRQRVIANAEGEASRFKSILVEYSRAPAVTRERLYLEAMQQVYSSTTKVMVDQKAGGSLLMLPLEKIIQMSAAGAVPAEGGEKAPATEVAPTAPPASDARTRDTFRSREREARP